MSGYLINGTGKPQNLTFKEEETIQKTYCCVTNISIKKKLLCLNKNFGYQKKVWPNKARLGSV